MTYQEAPEKAEFTHRKTVEAIERRRCRTCQCPQDLAGFFKKGARSALEDPPEPDGTMKRTKKAIWSTNVKMHVERKNILE